MSQALDVKDLQPVDGYQPRKAIAAGKSYKGSNFGVMPYAKVHGAGSASPSKYKPDGRGYGAKA